MYDFQTMLCQSRDGVFSAWFELNEIITESDLMKAFILINKYFPDYFFESDDFLTGRKKWEGYVLEEYEYRPNSFNNIYLTTKVYVQDHKSNIVLIEPEDDSLEIIYGNDEGIPVFGVQFYPYVYFDKNFVYLKGTSSIEKTDQSIAAKMNRSNLAAFLKDLEHLLNAQISYFESGKYLSKDFVYKYGIREGAEITPRWL